MEGVDCHIHLYVPDARWAGTRPAVARGDLPAYRALQPRLPASRAVVVQPLLYGNDNGYLLEQLRALGSDAARGIAIARASIADAELDALREAGVMGLRFFAGSALAGTGGAQPALAAMRQLAPRLRERGMHLQVNTNGRFLEAEPTAFEGLACPLVFDHLGHVLPRDDGGYTGLDALLRLLDHADAWVKVSGLYLDSKMTDCSDMQGAVQALVQARPDRVVWGTNWPHPTVHEGEPVPDDAELAAQVRAWVHDIAVLHGNAERLYAFP